MSSNNSFKRLYRFPTKDEIEKLSTYELYLIAKRSKEFRGVILDFLMSNAIDKEVIYIQDLDIPMRLKNALLRSRVMTLNELILLSKSEILKLKGLGLVKFKELLELLDKYDIQLAKN